MRIVYCLGLLAACDLPAQIDVPPTADLRPPVAALAYGDCAGGPLTSPLADMQVKHAECNGMDTPAGRRCLPTYAWWSWGEVRDGIGSVWYPVEPNQPSAPLYVFDIQLSSVDGRWHLVQVLWVPAATLVGDRWRVDSDYWHIAVPIDRWRLCQ